MKLESLKNKKVENLNEILGGDSRMGLEPTFPFEGTGTLHCVGDCHAIFEDDHGYYVYGNTLTLD